MSFRPEFFTVVHGEDRLIALRIMAVDGTPYNLTGNTEIKAKFRKSDNNILTLTKLASNGVKAKKTYAGVTYTASATGVLGNSISLVFTGIDSITAIVNTWNAANPSNTVTHNSSSPASIPAAGTVTLVDGANDYSSIVIVDAVSGRLSITLRDEDSRMLRLGDRQDFTVELTAGVVIRIVNYPRAISVTRQLV